MTDDNFTYTDKEGCEMNIDDCQGFKHSLDREKNHRLTVGNVSKEHLVQTAEQSNAQIDTATHLLNNKNVMDMCYNNLYMILLFVLLVYIAAKYL
jgi:hypothetical protein